MWYLKQTFIFSLLLASTVPCCAEEILLEKVLITLIEQVDVPSQEAGVLSHIILREGAVVKKGQIIARLEGKVAETELAHAKMQLKIAIHHAQSRVQVDLAKKVVQQEEQTSQQHKYDREIANHLAKNSLKIEAAIKGKEVAKNELDRALRARKQFAQSISESEIDNRKLSLQRATLESDQAKFEQKIDGLKAEAQEEKAHSHKLSVERSNLELARARDVQQTHALQSELQKLEVEKAGLTVQRRLIYSPIEGVVVELYRQKGEWVKPGEPVFRILRLNRLRAEGFLSIERLNPSPLGAKVIIRVSSGNGSAVEISGKVVFVSPEVDPNNREVRIWAEFDNPKLQVLPGMRGSMSIKLKSSSIHTSN